MVKSVVGETASIDALRAELTQDAVDVARLEATNRFRFVAHTDGHRERAAALRTLLATHADERHTLWASYNWVKDVDLATALREQDHLAQLVDRRQLPWHDLARRWARGIDPHCATRGTLACARWWGIHHTSAYTRIPGGTCTLDAIPMRILFTVNTVPVSGTGAVPMPTTIPVNPPKDVSQSGEGDQYAPHVDEWKSAV
jgi:hypothetical protein